MGSEPNEQHDDPKQETCTLAVTCCDAFWPLADVSLRIQRRQHPEPFDLLTAVVAADAPVAEVLAVVAQQVEGVLAQSRAGALQDLLHRIPRMRMIDDVERMTERKLAYSHFLDGARMPGARETRVVNHAPVALSPTERASLRWTHKGNFRAGVSARYTAKSGVECGHFM
jgi:hypothetical protein